MMRIWPFRTRTQQPTQPVERIVAERLNEVAWGERLLNMMGTIPKYNPDELVTRRRFDIYSRMMTDEQVKAVVRFKRDAITSRDFLFEFPDEVDLSDEEQRFRLSLFLHFTRCIRGSFLDSLNFIMTSMYQGFSMVEKVYDVIDFEGRAYVGPRKLSLKPHESFYFFVDDFGEVLKVEQSIAGNTQSVDLKKFIHHVQNPEVDAHYGQSELRSAYRSWFNKEYAIQLLSMFLERHASGFIWATPKDEADLTAGTPVHNTLKKILSNVQAGTTMIVPPGVELNYQSPATTDQFEKSIALYNLSIAKSLLVPNLLGITETGAFGSRALGEEHVETFLWTLDADSQRLEESINEQLFRELGDLNFGDGVYPFFKFKPISDRKKMELMSKWNELVQGKSVRPIAADENHLRGMLDFPMKDKEDSQDEDAEATDPQAALTGVQIKSLLEIISNVANEKIPRDTGVQLIVRSFPFNLEQAEQIMGEVGKGFKPAKPVMPPGLGGPEQEPGQSPDAGDGEGDPEETDPDDDSDEEEQQAVTRNTRTSRDAFTRASKRVDFAVLDRKERGIVGAGIDALSNHFDKMIAELTAGITPAMLQSEPQEIRKAITPNSRNVTTLKKLLVSSMREGWNLGQQHAKDEMGKVQAFHSAVQNQLPESMRPTIDFVRIDDIAAKFFEAKAFTVTGKLTEDMINAIQGSVLQGIKASRTTEQITQDVYSRLASAGMVSPTTAAKVLGENLEVENPVHRLRTIIRTNTNEAINEARYATFTDPALSGFVQALEYSATLDENVTEICEELNGRTYAAEDPVWDVYRPPNHMNCRSILIAVTSEDVWERDKDPVLEPQKGFG